MLGLILSLCSIYAMAMNSALFERYQVLIQNYLKFSLPPNENLNKFKIFLFIFNDNPYKKSKGGNYSKIEGRMPRALFEFPQSKG